MTEDLVEANINKHIGQKLKFRRLILGKSLAEIAKLIGVSTQQVQKYETGKNNISNSKLISLSKILEVDINYFFEGIFTNYKLEDPKNEEKIAVLIHAFNSIDNTNIENAVIDLVEALANKHISKN
jgi:transcriptional regulator with XRE-family HTH domain